MKNPFASDFVGCSCRTEGHIIVKKLPSGFHPFGFREKWIGVPLKACSIFNVEPIDICERGDKPIVVVGVYQHVAIKALVDAKADFAADYWRKFGLPRGAEIFAFKLSEVELQPDFVILSSAAVQQRVLV